MKKHQQLAGMLCVGIMSLGPVSTADAALSGRLPITPGGSDFQAYYDEDLGVTWLKSTTLARSNTFGVAGIAADGTMTWDTANTWINAMNADGVNGYLGFNDWRLPITIQPDPSCSYQYDAGGGLPVQGSGSGCVLSEMGHLYNVEGIEWSSYVDPSAPENPFSDLDYIEYWSATEFAPNPTRAWAYGFDLSAQTTINKSGNQLAWAVRSGDVSAVPVPAAIWLFASGLLGLLGFVRKRGRND